MNTIRASIMFTLAVVVVHGLATRRRFSAGWRLGVFLIARIAYVPAIISA